jgi:hypothetical protein
MLLRVICASSQPSSPQRPLRRSRAARPQLVDFFQTAPIAVIGHRRYELSSTNIEELIGERVEFTSRTPTLPLAVPAFENAPDDLDDGPVFLR